MMSLSQNKIGPCLKIENLQGLLKVRTCLFVSFCVFCLYFLHVLLSVRVLFECVCVCLSDQVCFMDEQLVRRSILTFFPYKNYKILLNTAVLLRILLDHTAPCGRSKKILLIQGIQKYSSIQEH